MQKFRILQQDKYRTLKFIIVGGSLFGTISSADTSNYTKAPMTAWTAMMDDPLLGNNYEKPAWNLHDTLKLPEWLSVGLEQRTRYESIANTFKPADTSKGNYYNSLGDQVLALQTDLWVQAKFDKFRLAIEVKDARGLDTDSHSYINNNTVDTIDFAQAYFSWANKNAFNSGDGLEIKIGRQAMDLGSRRMVARPIYRNILNSFTGIRTRLVDFNHWQLNTFVTMPVVRFPTGSNRNSNNQLLYTVQQFDQEATRTWFSGSLLEGYNFFGNINAELYLYHLDEGDSWLNPTHKRRYFTPGIRFYIKPKKGQFDFQAEGIGQFGTVRNKTTDTADRTHEAWSQHIEAGYSFDLPWAPRIFLEYDYATGSRNMGTGTDSRFDPLYAASDMDFGPTGIWSAFQRTNINSPGYKLDLSPTSAFSFRIQQRLVWLASANDCWGGASCFSSYTPVLVANSKHTSGSYVGNQFGITGRYNYNTSLNFEAGYFHLFKGQFAKEGVSYTTASAAITGVGTVTPGADSDYFYMQSQMRF